ncbi:hypothetical protein Pcinc_008596 [Petrolisthes cinctipes]|uniref:Uncharacterized protein n=1 Tax=Petrolisthes cinctipes TaxID=88211 RepID=A0AAE1KXE1_PETCI|nr:hypothetical protein Pcinc_008596 [Petrolisthes cinctipes]
MTDVELSDFEGQQLLVKTPLFSSAVHSLSVSMHRSFIRLRASLKGFVSGFFLIKSYKVGGDDGSSSSSSFVGGMNDISLNSFFILSDLDNTRSVSCTQGESSKILGEDVQKGISELENIDEMIFSLLILAKTGPLTWFHHPTRSEM